MTDDQTQRTKDLLVTLGCVLPQDRHDHAAWRELLLLWYKPFIKHAMRRRLDEDAAVDVAVDAVAKAAKYAHTFDTNGNATGWMFVICGRLCYDRLKQIKREDDRLVACEHEPRHVRRGTAVVDLLEQQEQVAAIVRAFERLSSKHRAVCLTNVNQNHRSQKRSVLPPESQKELQSSFALNRRNRVNQRLCRAKKKLKTYYEEEVQGQP